MKSLSRVWLFVTPRTVACQASLSMEFSRQEYWSDLPCPPPGDLPNPGTEPTSLLSPAMPGELSTTSVTWEAVQRVAKWVDSEAGGLGPNQDPGMYWPWKKYLSSMYISFFLCKMGVTVAPPRILVKNTWLTIITHLPHRKHIITNSDVSFNTSSYFSAY